MNKKNFFGTLAVAAMAAMAMTSCDKSKSQADDKPVAAQAAPTETKIAFVEVDSIMSQYKFCKDYSLILQKKGQNIQSTLAQKQQALQAAAANFQQKLQQNAYTREQAQSIEASKSITMLCVTLYSISLLFITKTRSSASFSRRLATISSMPTRLTTSPTR